MSSVDNTNFRRSGAQRSDLHEARPLLQAIFLGIVLATALVAAAVVTGSNASDAGKERLVPATQPPVQTAVPHP